MELKEDILDIFKMKKVKTMFLIVLLLLLFNFSISRLAITYIGAQSAANVSLLFFIPYLLNILYVRILSVISGIVIQEGKYNIQKKY